MLHVIVEVRSGRWQERRQLQLLECRADLRVADLKAQAEALAAQGGDVRLDYPAPPQPKGLDPYAPPPPRYPPREPRPPADLAMQFLGEVGAAHAQCSAGAAAARSMNERMHDVGAAQTVVESVLSLPFQRCMLSLGACCIEAGVQPCSASPAGCHPAILQQAHPTTCCYAHAGLQGWADAGRLWARRSFPAPGVRLCAAPARLAAAGRRRRRRWQRRNSVTAALGLL